MVELVVILFILVVVSIIAHILEYIHYQNLSRDCANYGSRLCSKLAALSDLALPLVPCLRLLPTHVPPVSYSDSDLHLSSKCHLQNLVPISNLSAAFPSSTHLRSEQGSKFLRPESESHWYLGIQSKRWGMSFGIHAVFGYSRVRHTTKGHFLGNLCLGQSPHQGAEEQGWAQRNSKQLLAAL